MKFGEKDFDCPASTIEIFGNLQKNFLQLFLTLAELNQLSNKLV